MRAATRCPVVELKFCHELTFEQIQEILQLPLITIKSRLYSGRQNLRERLNTSPAMVPVIRLAEPSIRYSRHQHEVRMNMNRSCATFRSRLLCASMHDLEPEHMLRLQEHILICPDCAEEERQVDLIEPYSGNQRSAPALRAVIGKC